MLKGRLFVLKVRGYPEPRSELSRQGHGRSVQHGDKSNQLQWTELSPREVQDTNTALTQMLKVRVSGRSYYSKLLIPRLSS